MVTGPTLPFEPVLARRRRLALFATTSVLVVAGATGCAGTNTVKDKQFTGEQGRVANTVRDLDKAYTDEQSDDTGARDACRTLLSKRLVSELSRNGSCEKYARLALKDSDPQKLDVQKVDVNGDTATVLGRIKLSDKHQRTDTLKLVREGNTWKFDGTQVGKATDQKG